MRSLVVVAMTSLDGFYEGPDGDLSAMGVDDGFNAFNAERIEAAGAVVIGRRSFESFASYWPGREDEDDASENEKRFARPYRSVPKTVVGHVSMDDVPLVWRARTDVVTDGVAERVAALKAEDGRPVVVWGSRTLWHHLVAEGLVDELQLVVGTGIVGSGTPLFGPDFPAVTLRAAGEPRRLPSSECVVLTYTVEGS